MARQVQITFDAGDPHALAVWWAARLGLAVEDNSALVATLLSNGVLTEDQTVEIEGRVEFADAAAAVDPDGNLPRFYFQRVPEPKDGKNRIHLDIHVEQDELDEEVAEWTDTGATFVEFRNHPGHRWAVMQDPDGNEFCLH